MKFLCLVLILSSWITISWQQGYNMGGYGMNQQQQQQQQQQQNPQYGNAGQNYAAYPPYSTVGPYGQNASTTPSTSTTSGYSAIITVTLKSYTHQQRSLPSIPGGATYYCGCTPGQTGPFGTLPQCKIGISVLVPSEGGQVQTYTSDFYPMDAASGALNASGQNDIFQTPWTVYVNSKPKMISFIAQHHGGIYDAACTLHKGNTVSEVDTFAFTLSDNPSGSISSAFPTTSTVQGQKVGSVLTFSYTVQCTTGMMGPNCDLKCNASSVDSNIAMCRSETNGYFSTCRFSGQNQVTNCQACPWGFGQDSYCRTAEGGVLEPQTAQVVPVSFRTATIVLACVAALLLLLLLIVTIYSCILVHRKMRAEEREAPGHNYHSSLRAEGSANRPLLQASYTAQSPSIQSDSFQQRPPAAAPRNVPSLDAVPAKSSLRKTNYVPPAHLGGGSSINDTLNSSFASSVPMPPSREADV